MVLPEPDILTVEPDMEPAAAEQEEEKSELAKLMQKIDVNYKALLKEISFRITRKPVFIYIQPGVFFFNGDPETYCLF